MISGVADGDVCQPLEVINLPSNYDSVWFRNGVEKLTKVFLSTLKMCWLKVIASLSR